ncbi:hypothetical protein BSAF29S_07189 [Bacillus safensis subsp. safensis]
MSKTTQTIWKSRLEEHVQEQDSAHRQKMMEIIDDWETSREEMDWYSFQQEYRDYIDLVKLFQLMPVVGAAVGGVANHQLTGQLGEVARHVFHLRILKEMK